VEKDIDIFFVFDSDRYVVFYYIINSFGKKNNT
jgi:hypothetical protein